MANTTKPQRVATAKTKQSNGATFYETMPLTAMPHSIFTDDVIARPATKSRRSLHSYSRTMSIALIIGFITLAVFVGLIIYGFSLINSSTAPANLSSGSLDL